MDEKYSIALFEDGTKEIIPQSWIQDYLKEENGNNGNESNTEMIYSIQEIPEQGNIQYSNLESFFKDINLQFNDTKKILQTLVHEMSDMKSVVTNLQKSVDKLTRIATGEPELEMNISQPAENLNDFLALEEYIKIKENYVEMAENLCKIGGKTVESSTRKIWNRLCTTELASKICWTGANGKYCLKGLHLNMLVRDAVLMTHPQGKETDIQRATIIWFSHAQDRLRTRKRQ